jgi:hypothetical protein
MAEIKQILIEIDLQTGNVVGGTEQVNKQLRALSVNAKLTTTEINKAAAAMQKNLAGSAGIAGAAATELGRTISDLPYGLGAVTNNISQLGNMFALLVTSAGGFTAALRVMWTTLMGPVGILVAFQAAIAGLELWGQAQRRAKKDTDDLKNSIDDINKSFGEQQSILDALGRAAIYSPEARAALAKNMKEVKAFLEAAESTGDVTAEVVDEAVRLGMNLLEARKNAALVEKEYLALIKDTNLEESERISAGTKLADAFRAVIAAENALNIQRQEGVTLTGDLVKATREQVDALKSLERISFALGRDAGGETIFESLFPLLRDEDGKAVGVVAGQAASRLIRIGKAATEGFQKWAKETESAREGEGNWFLDNLGMSEEKFTDTLNQVQQGLDSAFGLINAQFERELALEEAKTISINDQLRERLRNEQLTAEARDKINQEISKNDAALVEKQNEIEKKRFNLNKAQGISNAAINTALGITKALSTGNVPLAIFIGALGAAQVATIASQSFVPQASPTPNLTAQTPGGEAGGAEPQFNVIGATGQNQLAAAIAATQQQPVRAYVVSNEVTTAQSLDRNIVSEASL